MNNSDLNKFFEQFEKKFIELQEPLPPEFNKIFNENMWDLLS